jgi:probable HAF family extracellular repeat protein
MPKGAKPMAKAAVVTIGATLIGGLFVISASLQAHQVPCSYSVQVLPNVDCGLWQAPGGPTAVNNLGHVVGTFIGCGNPVSESFTWTGGDELIIIQRPAGILSFSAWDISDDGLIVGNAETTTAGQRGYIYNSNTNQWTPLPPPNPISQGWSSAESINNAGQVCGYRSVNDGGDPVNPWMAYIWTPGKGFTDLGLINGESTACTSIAENGAATGVMLVDGVFHGFLWIEGTIEDLGTISAMDTTPLAINSNLQVVGKSKVPGSNPFGMNHAFFWANGDLTDLGLFRGYTGAVAQDVDKDGVVIGFCREGTEDKAFIWNGKTLVELDLLVDPAAGVLLEVPGAINDVGQIIASARDSRGSPISVLLTPVILKADILPNCAVDVDDLVTVITEWGREKSIADINGDSIVDVDDLMIVLEEWTVE